MSQDTIKGIKNMYARAQFGATKLIILQDPTLNFVALLGIQMAPFLMTLVRKGKISTIVSSDCVLQKKLLAHHSTDSMGAKKSFHIEQNQFFGKSRL